MKKRIVALFTSICMTVALMGCGGAGSAESAPAAGGDNTEADSQAADEGKSGEDAVLNMAFQYGLAYTPLTLAQTNGYIEKEYEERTGGKLTVTWTQMSSGMDINTGIASGSIDVGFMGVGPAVTGATKGLGYKIFTGLSGQEHGLTVNDDSVNSLADLVGSDKQIALVGIGAIQHVILGMALDKNGFDAHALDANLVGMKHPDGMAAVESGNVTGHLTSSPYIYKERDESSLHELKEISDIWTADRSFIVGVAAETLHDEKPELYEALCAGIADAIDYINNEPEAAAKITYEFDGNTEEDELKYIQLGRYDTKLKGVYEVAKFMGEHDFIETVPGSLDELVFDNVEGD